MPLQLWFFDVQSKFPSFHVSCAGRGRIDQEACFARGASKAHYLQSAHSFNAAIDTFFQINGSYCLDANLYDAVAQLLEPHIDWYGKVGAEFPERPHFEVLGWQKLRVSGVLSPVEWIK